MWLCGYYFHLRESPPPLNIPTTTNYDQSIISGLWFLAGSHTAAMSQKPEIIDSINSSGKIEGDVEKLLNELILDLKKNFNS